MTYDGGGTTLAHLLAKVATKSLPDPRIIRFKFPPKLRRLGSGKNIVDSTCLPHAKAVSMPPAEPDIVTDAFLDDEILSPEEAWLLPPATDIAEPVATTPGTQPTHDDGRLPACPMPWRRPIAFLIWSAQLLFGLGSLIFLLSVTAAVPIANLYVLGYLLEVEGRVARSGRLRDAFPLIRVAPRVGSIAMGVWLWTVLLRVLANQSANAHIIDPGGPADRRLATFATVIWGVVTVHLCLALARGGGLPTFVRPIKNVRWLLSRWRAGDYLETASRQVESFVAEFQIQHHFSLGARGFVVAISWLIVPSVLYVSATKPEGGAAVFTILIGLLLTVVFAWVPFLQARFAAEDRFRAGFEIRKVKELYRHAPLAFLLALIVVYVLALPLYLFKAFQLPSDAQWPITLIFIVSIYPARVVTGWVYHRAVRRQSLGLRSSFPTRLLVRVGLIFPLLAVYTFILYFTQFIATDGKAELVKHHAFLLPWSL